MNYAASLQLIKDLSFDEEKPVYNDGRLELYLLRPSILSERFKDYDVAKNFQIWLKDGDRKFKPNHLRVMIDLDLRVRSRPDLREKLAKAFDDIFYGTDPDDAIAGLKDEKFEHFLNSLEITAHLSQLFLLEQAYGYKKDSKYYDPKTLFYQGWVRQVLMSGNEIDNLMMSIASGNTPRVGYTYGDNKKHKKHLDHPESLWWLN